MPLVLKDRVKETSTTTGTGTFTLAGASTGFQSFSVIGNGNQTYYTITDGTDWEVGIGTYTSSGTTLSRDTILESSNAGSAVNWGAGSKDVFVTYPAEKSVNLDAAGDVNGYDIENSPIGATTPAAGTFTTLTANTTSEFGRSSANYWQAIGAATTLTPQFVTLGSDTNIPVTFRSKGTGAVNLAGGSRGVNISNGGTVTAITATGSGSGYTSIPSATVSAPTTAGGVQATADVLMFTSSATVVSGGTGYTNGDVLTIVGGSRIGGGVGTYTVTGVSGGVITSVSRTSGSGYSVLPSNPVSTTGGTGSGATLNLTWNVSGASITNAGSGYVEQPTITFSGGGGSFAAAYATVGSSVTVKSIHGAIAFTGPQNTLLNLADTGNTAQAYLNLQGSNSNTLNYANGSSTNVGHYFITKGTGQVSFTTNGSTTTEQLRVTHTASAVNYVQVTGAATGSGPFISVQGSDSNPNITLQSKGTGNVVLMDGGGNTGVRLLRAVASGDTFLDVRRDVGFVDLIAASSVTNGDIRLTPKGTGLVRFGTHTAIGSTTYSIDGYIEVKDSAGNIRKLAVLV